VSGTASVIDADTIQVGRTRIRLYGIDAPEQDQTCSIAGSPWNCGRAATRVLAQKLGNEPVECQTKSHDQYGRDVAVCRADGEDVGGWLVSQGWALAYRYFSLDYVPQEQRASAAKLGIWQGEFVSPWEWRRGNRTASPQPAVRQPTSVVYQRFGDSKTSRYESLAACSKAREQDGGKGICIVK
jgi:endonuclease YncB( thermonuclease family)